MKNENYITIQGWMVNELHLSGNELLVYALVYGFSQDGESEFNGSLSYVADIIGRRTPVVSAILARLAERGLIEGTIRAGHTTLWKVCDFRTPTIIEGHPYENRTPTPTKIEHDNNRVNNRDNNRLTLNKRAQEFFTEAYEKSTDLLSSEELSKFCAYWSEPNRSRTKMRYELERTWDMTRRLKTWAERVRPVSAPRQAAPVKKSVYQQNCENLAAAQAMIERMK